MVMKLKERCREIVVRELSFSDFKCPYQAAQKAIFYGLSSDELTMMAFCYIPIHRMAKVLVDEMEK